jgi:hypothetical protein
VQWDVLLNTADLSQGGIVRNSVLYEVAGII